MWRGLDGSGRLVREPTLAELVHLAERAARAAGALIRDERPEVVQVAATKSSATDIVTVMDQRSEDLLREILLQARPSDGLLGEEDGGVPGTSGITWVVDPIDGTVNYLYGIPAYAVSVAAVRGDPWDPHGHEVLAGCVHNPVTGDTFTAGRGAGATLDGRAIHPRPVSDLHQVLLATGFSYEPAVRSVQAQVLTNLLPRVRDIRRMGSAALDLCQVACGRVDAYYERGLKPWDLAAGHLVAREAGACVTGPAHGPPGPGLVLAAAPGVHAALEDLLLRWAASGDAV